MPIVETRTSVNEKESETTWWYSY